MSRFMCLKARRLLPRAKMKPLSNLNDRVKAGDVVIVRYEGPRGGPGMQEMLYPTSYIKSKNLGKACALDYRWSFFWRYIGAVHRSCVPRGRRWRQYRSGAAGRYDPHRYPQTQIEVLVSDDELASAERSRNAWAGSLSRASTQGFSGS